MFIVRDSESLIVLFKGNNPFATTPMIGDTLKFHKQVDYTKGFTSRVVERVLDDREGLELLVDIVGTYHDVIGRGIIDNSSADKLCSDIVGVITEHTGITSSIDNDVIAFYDDTFNLLGEGFGVGGDADSDYTCITFKLVREQGNSYLLFDNLDVSSNINKGILFRELAKVLKSHKSSNYSRWIATNNDLFTLSLEPQGFVGSKELWEELQL